MTLTVAVLDTEESLRKLITLIVQYRGHEVAACPEPLHCPVYSGTGQQCDRETPCRDIMIFDRKLPKMSALSYIGRQSAGGCKINNWNKLVLSTKATQQEKQVAEILGCSLWKKPFRVEDIHAWIDECCEGIKGMDPIRESAQARVAEGR